jgi:hypothetical protein
LIPAKNQFSKVRKPEITPVVDYADTFLQSVVKSLLAFEKFSFLALSRQLVLPHEVHGRCQENYSTREPSVTDRPYSDALAKVKFLDNITKIPGMKRGASWAR